MMNCLFSYLWKQMVIFLKADQMTGQHYKPQKIPIRENPKLSE